MRDEQQAKGAELDAVRAGPAVGPAVGPASGPTTGNAAAASDGGADAHAGPAAGEGSDPHAGPGADAAAAADARAAAVRAAEAEQHRLRALVRTDSAPDLRLDGAVAGADVAYDDAAGLCAAAVVVVDGRTLEVLDRAVAVRPVEFPYVPGLLAFREAPPLLAALDGLRIRPDVLVCDGYGVAHPRRAGLASHVGVLTGVPCVGVAKNPLTFVYAEPARQRGAWTELTDRDTGETVGRALRTRDSVKPLFVSSGHLVGLDDACALTLRLAPRYRQPETTRLADRLCRDTLAEATGGPAGR